MTRNAQAARSESPLLKICGLVDPDTAGYVGGLHVDYAGFVFAPSRRRVSAEQAADLIGALRDGAGAVRRNAAPAAVGVFVQASAAELEQTLGLAPLDVLQLHGQESPDDCRAAASLGVRLWKAIHAFPDESRSAAERRLTAFAEAGVDAFLLDTAGGGTGRTFDWSVIPLYQEIARQLGKKLFVAGGLNGDNVDELISMYAPQGIDVSSGVESAGVKDPELIRAFTERVKTG